MELDDPAGYGRIVRDADGRVERVVETKAAGDATEEELAIREVNAGVYLFDGGALLAALGRARQRQRAGRAVPARRAAAAARRRASSSRRTRSTTRTSRSASTTASTWRTSPGSRQARIHRAHQRAGVTIVDPASTLIEADVAIGHDTTIEPSTFLRGATPDRRSAAASGR